MKMNWKNILLVISIVGLLYFMYNKWKASKPADQQEAPPALPPPAATTTAQTNTSQSAMLANSEPAASAIRSRVQQLYNSTRREEIFSQNNTRELLYAGLSYRAGVRSVVAQQSPYGNADLFPIVPIQVNEQYRQRLLGVADLEGFEEMTSRGQFELAKTTWKNALNLEDVGGLNLWPENIMDILRAGLFFVSGKADKNMSERYDSYCKDMQTLCANAVRCIDKASNQFQNQAIVDLRDAGWNIV